MKTECDRLLRDAAEERKLEATARVVGLLVGHDLTSPRNRRMGLDKHGESDEFAMHVNRGIRKFKEDPNTIEAVDVININDDYIFDITNEVRCLGLKDKDETNLGLGGRPPKYESLYHLESVPDLIRFTRQQHLAMGTRGSVVVPAIISCFFRVAGGTGSKGRKAAIPPEHILMAGGTPTMALKLALERGCEIFFKDLDLTDMKAVFDFKASMLLWATTEKSAHPKTYEIR
jgi:hypothetical protein